MTPSEGRNSKAARPTRRSLAWLLASFVAVGLTLYLVGFEGVLRTLATTDTRTLLVLTLLTGGAVITRGIALRLLFAIVGCPVSVGRAVALYIGTTFLNNVTPSGQAGGIPASGLLIARAGDAPYEVGVAIVLTLNVLSNLVMLVFGVFGVGYILMALPGAGLGTVAVATVGLLLLVIAGIVALFRYRRLVTALAVTTMTVAADAVGRHLDRWSPPDRAAIEDRIDRFWASLERVGDATLRQAVAVAALLGTAHVMNIGALWFVLRSFDGPVAFAILLAVVPTAVVAAIVPVPTGASGVSIALVGLLITTTAVAGPTAGAAVVLYRSITHWFRTLVGGIVTAVLLGMGPTNSR